MDYSISSILNSIKKPLGIPKEHTAFDQDILMYINSTFVILHQLGVGPSEGFYIEDDSATWDKYIENPFECNAVKTYMYAKVKLVFDPPSNSAHIECLKQTVAEFEWRLHT